MSKKLQEATTLLKKVKKDYTKIAGEFHQTRRAAWPEFEVFKKKVFGDKQSNRARAVALLDAGCGNGRLFNFLEKSFGSKNFHYTGIDNNRTLLKIAKTTYPKAKFRYGDLRKLPFSSASFDSVWAIAVLHHLPSEKMCLAGLKEIKRVLKKNGTLCITVWNLWQPNYRHFINKKTHDALIPWGQNKKIQRYYYAFRATEVKKLLERGGFVKTKRIQSRHNFAFICSTM